MDGDKAPLEELSNLALQHKALCIVDEAHAVGLYGREGGGLCTLLKKTDHIICVYPCGKAFISNRCFCDGSEDIKGILSQ